MRFRTYFALLLVLGLLVGIGTAHAGGTDVDVTQSNDMNNQTAGDINISGGDLVGGDTSIVGGDTKTFAFAYGMGDVDINEGQNCMGSEQWGTVIVGRQTMELNPWCASLFYELNGKHEFAAKMRCQIKEVGKFYKTDEECWLDQTLRPDEPVPTSGYLDSPAELEAEIIEQVEQQYAEQHEMVEYRIAQQQNLIESLQQENDQLEHRIQRYKDDTADIREWAEEERQKKARAQAILADKDEES